MCIPELMREAAAWFLVAVLLAVLLWPKPPAPADNSEALRAQNDSLKAEIAARTTRHAQQIADLDSANRWYDSAWRAQPPAETLYIGHRAQAASLPYRRKWADMGTIPVDTSGGHAE